MKTKDLDEGSARKAVSAIVAGPERQATWEFFVFFSRFEHSLKRTEIYAKGDQNIVEADWDKFAKDHDELFALDKTPELKAAIDYLESNPPKKQVLKLGKLGWKDVPKQNNKRLQCLLLAIRRVRNNLFHGGKYPFMPISDPSRNTVLLLNSITILNACLKLDKDVATYFIADINE